MGKNRKAKQLVDRSEIQSEDDGCCNRNNEEVPLDFLTSDDFQVVHKKRHQPNKKSPDESVYNGCNIHRSRSNSERFLEKEDIFGCHAGFWTVRNHEATADSKEPIKIPGLKKRGTLLKLKSEGDLSVRVNQIDKPGHEFYVDDNNPSVEIEQISPNGRGKNITKVLNSENTVSVEGNCTLLSETSEEIKRFHFEKGNLDIGELNPSTESLGDEISCPMQNSAMGNNCANVADSTAKITISFVENFGSGESAGDVPLSYAVNRDKSTDDFQSNSSASEGTILKASSQKKKNKKTGSKQKVTGAEESGTNKPLSETNGNNGLAYSSSSDFSEISNIEKTRKAIENTKKECEKRDRKRPSKKQLEAIHEALRKAKEEEERLKKEEEAKRKLAEEAAKLALEKLRLEQEKKEKKKLKDKQKREKMKAEGKLLSKSQKQSRARMAATLEVLRQQGIDVPQIGEKRPRGPRLGNYKNTHRKRLDSSQSDTSQVASIKSERHKSESLSSQESSGKESLSDLPNSFDSKDSFDQCTIESLCLTTESDEIHCSCSEESDEDPTSCVSAPSAKEALACKLKESISKANLSNLTPNTFKVENDEKKDSIKLRSPVICVLGHVDTGKTKLLDYIRKTHVQDSEAGGITQQIGATMIPQGALKEKCKMVNDFSSFEMKVPGLLVIDTPGHESFNNLRIRGTSICDIAILVVDIMHGLEPQTIESINLLKTGKIPFIVALNKIDRLYGWKSAKDKDVENTVNSQNHNTLMEFKRRCQEVELQFANQCLNASLYYENKDPRKFISMVPTSAITGDGMGNLLSLITQLTQTLMYKKLIFTEKLQATVLEVKVLSGLGTTIDVILVNGRLHEGDTIVIAGQEGPIVTQIRSLLMPQPLKELRVKNPYIEYKMIEGAQGVKITGKDLEKSIAGLPLYVAQNPNQIELLKTKISLLWDQNLSCIKTSERGVYVQASTLGSLEALLGYLTSLNIPYFGVKIGPVVKKDVMKASIMLEHEIQYATILAFDVKIERDAQELADSLGVKIIHAKVIYHLFDEFLKHREAVNKKLNEMKHLAVFPCIVRPLTPVAITNPLVVNVIVEAGSLHEGTPLCVTTKGNSELGTVSSIEVNGGPSACAKEGEKATITVERDATKILQLDEDDCIVSRITRQSVEICKEYFRDTMDSSDWELISELKKMLHNHG